MKYKAIVCDLDGTLLNSQHTISKYTRDVIKDVTNLGVKFFIATGRHHMDALNLKRCWDWIHILSVQMELEYTMKIMRLFLKGIYLRN